MINHDYNMLKQQRHRQACVSAQCPRSLISFFVVRCMTSMLIDQLHVHTLSAYKNSIIIIKWKIFEKLKFVYLVRLVFS